MTCASVYVTRVGRRARARLSRLGRLGLVVIMLTLAMPQVLPAQAAAADSTLDLPAVIMPAASVHWPDSGVIDYSARYTPGTAARMKSAGVGIVIRYVGSSAWKCLTRAEANAIRGAGLDIASVYETSAGWMLGGRKAGVSAARKARAAVVACGGPRSAFIYFACDRGTHNYAAVNACLRGAASVLGADRVGIYGSYSVCANALKSGYATKAWQTIAWSGGKVLPGAALYQTTHRVDGSVGLSYDSNFPRADDIGQWGYAGPGNVAWSVQPTPTSATLNAVDSAGPEAVWAVGDSGAIVHSGDGGATWTSETAPTTVALRAVDFVGSVMGWVVGDDGTVIHTTDGGTSWVPQTVPTAATLRAVRFADASTGWAVGDGGTAIHTVDGGATWTRQSVPTTAPLTAVDFAGTASGWAVGGGGTVLHTVDGGVTWAAQSVPTSATLASVCLTDPRTGWAVGDAGTILRTTNGGAKWARQSTPTTAALSAVQFLDSAAGWAVGGAGTMLWTTNGGATWVPRVAPTTAALTAVHFAGTSGGWATGASGTVLHATDAGLGSFGTVAGVVTSSATGKPVAGVSVSIGGRLTAPTAVDGSFVAARVRLGTCSVTCSNARYITRSALGVGVSAGLRTVVNVALTPKTVTSLSKPSIIPTAPLPGQPVTFTVSISPTSAATAAVTRIYGSHYEQKTARKRVKGKTKKVKVWYWRSVFSLKMSAETSGSLVAQMQLAAGAWRVHAKFPGSGKYLPSASATRSFSVVAPSTVPTSAGP